MGKKIVLVSVVIIATIVAALYFLPLMFIHPNPVPTDTFPIRFEKKNDDVLCAIVEQNEHATKTVLSYCRVEVIYRHEVNGALITDNFTFSISENFSKSFDTLMISFFDDGDLYLGPGDYFEIENCNIDTRPDTYIQIQIFNGNTEKLIASGRLSGPL